MRNISLLFIFVLFSGLSISQTVETFSTPGSYTWVCPANVTQVRVQCWGAGGGGGNSGGAYFNLGGSGGSGGTYSEKYINVVPLSNYFLNVGAGGLGASKTIAQDGESSFLYHHDTLILALGGAAGKNNSNQNVYPKNLNYSIGHIKHIGGYGFGGYSFGGGGGGGGACENQNGIDANNSQPGISNCSGSGGSGSSSYYQNGNKGNNPGGGGGGSYSQFYSFGGNGGNGQIILSYTPNCTSANTVIYPYVNTSVSCGTFLLSATNASTDLGLVYQWQMSLDSLNWVNLSNNKQLNYTQTTNKKITFYRVIIKCIYGDTSVSNVIKHSLNDQFIQKGIVSSDQDVCQGNLPNSNLVLTNTIGSIQWQKTTNLSTWSDISNANDTILSPSTVGALNVTTYFRAKVSSSGCGTIYSDSIKIYVSPLSVKGTISPSQNICEGNSFADISLTGSVGSIQWQKSEDGSNWIDIKNANFNTLSNIFVDTLKFTTNFRAIITSGVCPSVISSQTFVGVEYKVVKGILKNHQFLCEGQSPVTLRLYNHKASDFKWQYNSTADSSKLSNNWKDINTTNIDSFPGRYIGFLKGIMFYRCIYSNGLGVCPSEISNSIIVSYSPPSFGGNTSADQTICEDTNPASIKLSSNVGNSIYWQKSIDNVLWENIPNADSNKLILNGNQIGLLQKDTYIRASVKSGVCPVSYSTVRKITVNNFSNAGTIDENQIICYGNKPLDVVLKNFVGTLIWQYATPTSILNNNWYNITSTDPTKLLGNTIGVLKENRFIRAHVTNGVCQTVFSAIDTIFVSPLSVSGTLTSNQTICQGTTPSSVSIAGNVGNISWEKSTDGSSWSTILNASGNTLLGNKTGDLYTGTYLRGVIKSGACPSVTSNNVLISVDSTSFGGYPSVNQSLCIGSAPTNVSVSKYRGKINWQSSTDGYNFSDIPNATTSSLAPGAITSTTYYRTSAVNGVCPQNYSNSIQILVSPKSTVGNLTSSHIICAGLSPNTINLSSAVGAVSWQYSNDNLVWNQILYQSSLSLNNTAMGTLNSKRYYKAIVKSGICPSVTSNTITVSVNPKPIVSGGVDKSICQNSPITLTGNGATSYSWDNGIQNGVSFIPTKSTLYTIIGTNTYGCKDTATVNISLLPQPNIQIINPNSSIICQNSQFALNTNSTDVSSYQWRLNGVDIPNAKGSSINYNKSGNYSVLASSKDGCSQLSTELPITFTPLPTISAGFDRSICLGSSTQLIATQAENYNWQNNIQNGDSVNPTTTTKYIVSTTDNNGCSNSDTVTVFVNDKTYNEISLSSMDYYDLNGQVYNQTGKYTQVLKNKNGCDSIIILNLVIEHLGLNNIEKSTIKIYPNPTVDGKIYIESSEEIKQIQLLNTEGKILKFTENKEIDLGGYGRGVYFVEVVTSYGRGGVKIVY